MKRYPLAWLVAAQIIVSFIGCADSASEPQAKARSFVQGWAKQGMYLPNQQEVEFFRNNVRNVRTVLIEAVADPNPDVRQRAAYVIDEIGREASALVADVLDALKKEQNRLVRLYLFNALSSMGKPAPDVLHELRARFNELTDAADIRDQSWDYTPVDERICVAGALYELDVQSDRRSEYLDFVTQWLKSPVQTLSATAMASYWEHRWMAVNTLGNMPHAQSAIPLLEAMQKEPGKQEWVDVHAPRVLTMLNANAEN